MVIMSFLSFERTHLDIPYGILQRGPNRIRTILLTTFTTSKTSPKSCTLLPTARFPRHPCSRCPDAAVGSRNCSRSPAGAKQSRLGSLNVPGTAPRPCAKAPPRSLWPSRPPKNRKGRRRKGVGKGTVSWCPGPRLMSGVSQSLKDKKNQLGTPGSGQENGGMLHEICMHGLFLREWNHSHHLSSTLVRYGDSFSQSISGRASKLEWEPLKFSGSCP